MNSDWWRKDLEHIGTSEYRIRASKNNALEIPPPAAEFLAKRYISLYRYVKIPVGINQ